MIAIMTLNHILRKCTAGYQLSKSQKNQPHDVHGRYGRHDTFCQKRKTIRDPNINCENIQSRYRNGIWHGKIHQAINEKLQRTHNERIRTTKSNSHQKIRRKGNLKLLRNIGS